MIHKYLTMNSRWNHVLGNGDVDEEACDCPGGPSLCKRGFLLLCEDCAMDFDDHPQPLALCDGGHGHPYGTPCDACDRFDGEPDSEEWEELFASTHEPYSPPAWLVDLGE